MKKLSVVVLMLCLFCSGSLLADTLVAVDSCRTSLNGASDGSDSEVDENKSDSSKLSIRGDSKAAKSWIKFDVSSLDVGALIDCKLRITLHAAKDNTCLLSAVNDDYTTNIGWTEADLTWNTGPGNYTSTDGINPDAAVTLDQLQDDLDLAMTTLIGTVDYSEGSGGLAGDQYFIDVLSILQADTDGIVQFVLHGAGGDTSFSTHDHPNGAEYWPTLVYETTPAGCTDVGITHLAYADDSCRTSLNNASDGSDPEVDENKSDSSKLSIRSDEKAAKSWIKFDLNDLDADPNNLKAATLRVTLQAGKSSSCSLSYVNDSCLDNIDWTESDLTWNNAPGNYTSTDGINADMAGVTVDQLQEELDPGKATFAATVNYPDGQAGDQFTLDVLAALQEDTDGIVQFVLHDAGGSTNFCTHDHGGGEEYWPRLDILVGPAGADEPYPCPGDVVTSDLAALSWVNPDPNNPADSITCTVYLGTEPNRLFMDSVTLDPDAHIALINTTNFPNYGSLAEGMYYWTVDCVDPDAGLIEGMMWSFEVDDNDPPVVDAGPDQDAWLGMSGTPGQEVIDLDGTTSDDSGVYDVLWTQDDNGAPSVVIDPNDVDDTSVTITARGDYIFRLTADDNDAAPVSDTVRIVVGDDACDASHIKTSAAYDPGDVNQDCIVNLDDFALLIAMNWLDCTDTLMNCGN